MLWNIVHNALKYSNAGTALAIIALRDGDAVRLTIADRGPGIPPAARARVFEPFYRLPQSGARADGIGIGLAICKGMVEAHGGHITIHGRAGGGALVDLQLPLRPNGVRQEEPHDSYPYFDRRR